MVENEWLKVLYEELLKKNEEKGAVGGDKASETANIAETNVEQLKTECEQLKNGLGSWKVNYNELEQVDILISKNQVPHIWYLKYCVYKTTEILMDKKYTKSTKI